MSSRPGALQSHGGLEWWRDQTLDRNAETDAALREKYMRTDM